MDDALCQAVRRVQMNLPATTSYVLPMFGNAPSSVYPLHASREPTGIPTLAPLICAAAGGGEVSLEPWNEPVAAAAA